MEVFDGRFPYPSTDHPHLTRPCVGKNQAKVHGFARKSARGLGAWSFDLDFYRDRHDRESASVSWLRAAYIIAFATLGYRFVLGEAYHAVREKIADPKSTETIEAFKLTDPAAPADARTIAIIREPEHMRGLAVRMGRHLVFLPGPTDTSFYDKLKQHKTRSGSGARVTVRGWEIPWPRRPELWFDFSPPVTT